MYRIFTLPEAADDHLATDSGEGPWKTKAEALAFGQAEVGLPYVVVKEPSASRKREGRYFLITMGEDYLDDAVDGDHQAEVLPEGPWDVLTNALNEGAVDFGEAEVGVPWFVVDLAKQKAKKGRRQ